MKRYVIYSCNFGLSSLLADKNAPDKSEAGSPEPEKPGSGAGSSFMQGLKGFAEKGKNHFTDVGKAALKTAIKHPVDTAGMISGNPVSAIKTSYRMKNEYNRLQEARKASGPDSRQK